jgi:ABC-2 type transport system ATP-binding protein
MLEVEHLCRRYGTFVAVNRVSFTINPGEIVGLLGHNGAGKTTIMKMLSGYLEPNEGRIRIDGVDMDVDPKTVQRGLGYLPENLPVYPEMTVADYLDYAADLKGLQGDEKTREIRRAVQATEISEKLLSPIATLSRGFKQRVGVAQAILGKPKVLILDEPTNGLDPTQTDHMRALIKDIAKEATVILSTHIMQEVDAVCDRVLILRGGELAVDEKLTALRESNRLLLSCGLPEGKIKELITPIDGIKDVAVRQQSEFETDYQITLNENTDRRKVAATVSKAIVNAGGDLFQLQAEHRNLETLFREVSTAPVVGEGVKNAA